MSNPNAESAARSLRGFAADAAAEASALERLASSDINDAELHRLLGSLLKSAASAERAGERLRAAREQEIAR